MKKGRITSIVIAIIFILAGVVSAEPNKDCPMSDQCMQMHNGGFMKMFKSLDLTKAQSEKIKEIMAKRSDQRTALHEKIAADRQNVQKAIFADTFDEANIRNAQKAVAENMENKAVLRAKNMVEIKTVLTPEQLERLKTIQTKRCGKKFGKKDSRCPMMGEPDM